MKNKENMWKIIAIVACFLFIGTLFFAIGAVRKNKVDEKISEYDLMVDEYDMDEAS